MMINRSLLLRQTWTAMAVWTMKSLSTWYSGGSVLSFENTQLGKVKQMHYLQGAQYCHLKILKSQTNAWPQVGSVLTFENTQWRKVIQGGVSIDYISILAHPNSRQCTIIQYTLFNISAPPGGFFACSVNLFADFSIQLIPLLGCMNISSPEFRGLLVGTLGCGSRPLKGTFLLSYYHRLQSNIQLVLKA